MAEQTPQTDLKLRLHKLEAQMDKFVDRFEAFHLLLHDTIARTENIEARCRQMQESGRFLYDSDVQENASLDETAKPTQVGGDTVDKEDESVRGEVVEQADVNEFGKEVQKASNMMGHLQGILEAGLSPPSLEPTERRPREREGTTQGAGMSERGSVDEREEFEDENREQEELRQLEKPDESGELVQDLAASSENKEHFGQGAEELGEDSVELDTAKESGTALSERVKLGEGAEDSKRGDEEKGNDYELEAFEVEGCNQEEQLAEEVDRQEEAVQNEADSEEQTERKACIGEAKLESSEEMEESLSGERGKEEEMLQCKIEAEEETELGYKSQPVKIDEVTEEAKLDSSEKFGSRLSDEAGNQQEVLGSKVQEREKKQPDSELEMSAVKGCLIEVNLDTSKDSEMQLPNEIEKKDMIQNEIQETLTLITVNIENKMDVRMSYTLMKSVGDCITKLVESFVTELNQKVRTLEGKLTEQNRVNCRLKDEIRRLYTELRKTAKESHSLKDQVKAFQEKANTEALKQKVYQTYAQDLAGKCYDVSVSAEKGLMERRRKLLDYRNLKNKYEILKSKYKATAEYRGECEKTDLLDTETDQEMDELADEAMEREMALVLQCQRELNENFKNVFEAPPMVQHFEVEKVKNAEALNKCRMEVLEDIQKSPLSRLKAMEAILTKRKREYDYIWKGVINEQKLSLHETVRQDCPVLTNLLLEYGASRNAEDRKGNTPLHYAARNGNVVVGRALVEAGADVTIQNSRKMTPLHMALYHKHIYFSLMLLRSQRDVTLMDDNYNTALHLAALQGNAIIVRRLIEKGADVNAVDLDGDTPIFNAAVGGNVGTGEALVGAGADVSTINNDGSTPLHAAAWEGCDSFCFFLINQGAPVDPMNSHKVTPLHLAAMEDHEDIVQVLITRGARVNCLEERTDSPLHYAAKFANIAMMKALLRAGANVSAINSQRRTPLHIAAAKNHAETCLVLIKAGSDVNALDERDRTPLHMVAMYGGSISVAELLIKKGANMTAVDSSGLTSWNLGYTFKNVEFAAWLEEQIFARDGRREKGSVRKKGSRGKK